MANIYNEKFVLNGHLINKGGSLVFMGLGQEVFLLPYAAKRLPNLNFDSLECNLSFSASFITKPLGKSQHKVNLKKKGSFEFAVASLEIPEFSLTLENMNIFSPQSEELQDVLVEAINSEINNGRFEDLLSNEKTPYTYEEEMIALLIYIETQGRPYGDMMALIKEKIETGEIKRSEDSLEMRVNTFKSLDDESGLEGLGAKSQTKKIWEAYKNKQI